MLNVVFSFEFIGFGAMDCNCSYEFIGFGATDDNSGSCPPGGGGRGRVARDRSGGIKIHHHTCWPVSGRVGRAF